MYDCTCVACGDEFELSQVARTCVEHFMCLDCFTQAFKLATADESMEMFPAKCCGPIDVQLCGHLIPANIQLRYNWKAEQLDVDPTKRVYCWNCGLFQSPHGFDAKGSDITSKCSSCGERTCAHCTTAWYEEGHQCAELHNKKRPSWLAPYSESRTKACPACHVWIEMAPGTCNHMKCRSCNYQFCFICLLKWTGYHECEPYGEPVCGYDDEGYEIDRGIHRDTGLDRRGFNILKEHFKKPK